MDSLRLRCVDPASGELAFHDLRQDGGVNVQAIPGATGVHIALYLGDAVAFRGEVECSAEDTVHLVIERGSGGPLSVTCVGRDVYTLPLDAPEPRVARVPVDSKALDVTFVIDATARHCRKDPKGNVWSLASPLLSVREEAERHIADLASLFEALAAHYPDTRATVLAFGDEPMRQVGALDLTTKQYLLWPESAGERLFQSCSRSGLEEMLAAVPPSPGGDFIDALADALEACRALKWRHGARKLVIVTGDSPGHSLMHPPPPELDLDAHIRRLDVDVEALLLFETWGAEVVTIYHDVPRESGLHDTLPARDALAFARSQYRRLASRPALAVKKLNLSPESLTQALFASRCIGRGTSLPIVPLLL